MDEYEPFEEQTGLPIWKPTNQGEKLEGIITLIKDGSYGKQFTLRQADNEEIVTPSHKVLQSRLQSAEVGDKVSIEFLGLEPAKMRGQKPMAMYKVLLAKKKKMPL